MIHSFLILFILRALSVVQHSGAQNGIPNESKEKILCIALCDLVTLCSGTVRNELSRVQIRKSVHGGGQ
jgi:hypothetical protein